MRPRAEGGDGDEEPDTPGTRRNVNVLAAEITPRPQTNGMNARSTRVAGPTPLRW